MSFCDAYLRRYDVRAVPGRGCLFYSVWRWQMCIAPVHGLLPPPVDMGGFAVSMLTCVFTSNCVMHWMSMLYLPFARLSRYASGRAVAVGFAICRQTLCKRRPFALQKTVFYKAKGHVLQNITFSSQKRIAVNLWFA